MPIGHCLARNLFDAVQFCLLLDVMLLAIGVWSLNMYDMQDTIPETRDRLRVQTWAAAIGLAAALIFKSADKYISVAVLLGIASAAVFAFSATSEWRYASAVSTMADRGEVDVSGFFWPSEMLQYFFILIMVLNHLLLAHFGQKELRGRLGNKPVPNEERNHDGYSGDVL